MKKLLLLSSLCSIFLFTAFGQKTSNLVIFAEDATPFYAIVNGIKQNIEPQTNVKITGLTNEINQVRVIFKNTNIPSLNQQVYFQSMGVEATMRITNTKKGYKLRYFGEVPLTETTVVDNTQWVSVLQASEPVVNTGVGGAVTTTTTVVEEKVTTTTNASPTNTATNVNIGTTTNTAAVSTNVTTNATSIGTATGTGENVNIGMNVGGVGFNMNVNVTETGLGTNQNVNYNETTATTTTTNSGASTNVGTTTSGSVTTTTTTTTTSTSGTPIGSGNNVVVANPTPIVYVEGYSGVVGCAIPLTKIDAVKKAIEAEDFSENKMIVAKQATKNKCLTTAQVIEIAELFSFENEKLEYAKFAYAYTYDVDNYYQVNSVFSFSSSKEALNKHITTR